MIIAATALTGVGPEMTSRAPRASRTAASSRVHMLNCLIARSQTTRSISLSFRSLGRARDMKSSLVSQRVPEFSGPCRDSEERESVGESEKLKWALHSAGARHDHEADVQPRRAFVKLLNDVDAA